MSDYRLPATTRVPLSGVTPRPPRGPPPRRALPPLPPSPPPEMDFGMDEPEMVFGPSPSVMARKKKARPPRAEMMFTNWKFPKPRGGNFDMQYTMDLPRAFVEKYRDVVPRSTLEAAWQASDDELQAAYVKAVNELETIMPQAMAANRYTTQQYLNYRGWTQSDLDSLRNMKGAIEDIFGYREQGVV